MTHLPNLLVVGAAKAGTTSLHRYLHLHPDIYMSKPKELKFFNRADWSESLDGYRSHFPVDSPVRGESSPAYSMAPTISSVPERIHRTIPHAKIIYMVRDPVARTIAQYVEFLAMRLEERPVDEVFADCEDPSNVYVAASRYAYQLDLYREHFADSQILVLDQHVLASDRSATLRGVFEFLGVDPEFTSPDFAQLHNVRGRKVRLNQIGLRLHRRGTLARAREVTRVLPGPIRERSKRLVSSPLSTPPVTDAIRERIAAAVRDDAERLRRYLGDDLRHWAV